MRSLTSEACGYLEGAISTYLRDVYSKGRWLKVNSTSGLAIIEPRNTVVDREKEDSMTYLKRYQEMALLADPYLIFLSSPKTCSS